MIKSNTFVADTLYFIKHELVTNITDPLTAAKRGANSKFVMTSYPQRKTEYPLITLKVVNYNAKRAGMQTTTMDLTMNIEIRIWARNTKERDTLFQSVLNRLRSIQFSTGGSVLNSLHNFNVNSATEVDEEKIKSKVLDITYQFYNL